MDFYIFIINVASAITRREAMLKKIALLQSSLKQNVIVMDYEHLCAHIQDSKNANKSNDCINLYISFFPATDKQDIESGKIKIPQYNPNKVKFVRGKELNTGEQACFHSHYRAWKLCEELKVPIIVLEDDVEFSDNMGGGLLDIANSGLEYVRLMYLFDKKVYHLRNRFYLSFGRLGGTQGYFLHPSAAKKFIAKQSSWIHCVDNYMDMFFLHNVLNIVYIPHLITSIENISSVQDSNKQPIKWHNKLTRELSQLYLFGVLKPTFIVFHIYKICKLKHTI